MTGLEAACIVGYVGGSSLYFRICRWLPNAIRAEICWQATIQGHTIKFMDLLSFFLCDDIEMATSFNASVTEPLLGTFLVIWDKYSHLQDKDPA